MNAHQPPGILRGLARWIVATVGFGGVAACGGGSSSVIVGSPAGYAYVTSVNSSGSQAPGAVFQYAVGSDGSLTALAVATVPAGPSPVAIATDPTGRFVYVVNGGDATISQFTVGSDGVLTPLSPATVPVSGAISGATVYPGITIDPSGRILYVVTRAQDPAPAATIAQHSIGTDGALSPLVPPTQDVQSFAGPLVIHPSGQFAYITGITSVTGSNISQYSRDASGALTPLIPATVPGTANAGGIYVGPGGQAAYALQTCIGAMCDGQIGQYAIGSDGTLGATGNSAVLGSHVNPVALATDATGSSVYVLANEMGVDTNVGILLQYSVNTQGSLAPKSPASLTVDSGAVALVSHGLNLYALSSNAIGFASGAPTGGHVNHYSVNADGSLGALGSTAVPGNYPTGMTAVFSH
jgi:6-phosphogluconolactonase (cycloisomerase 2 family)